MSDAPDHLLEVIFSVLLTMMEHGGVLLYAALIFIGGFGVAVLWPFGGTPADVITGYAIVVATIASVVLLIKWFFRSIN